MTPRLLDVAEALQLLEDVLVEVALAPRVRAGDGRRSRRGAPGGRAGTTSESADSSTCPSSSRLLGRPSRCRTVGATSRSETVPRSPGATGAPKRTRSPSAAVVPPRARRPGSPTSTSTSLGPEPRHGLADEPVHEAVLVAHRGELGVEAGEVARRRLAQLLHGEDVEPGQVERLEVRAAPRRAARGRRRGESGRDGGRGRARTRRAADAVDRRPPRGTPRGRALRPSRA